MVKGIVRDDDVLGDVDFIGNVIGMIKDAGDDEVLIFHQGGNIAGLGLQANGITGFDTGLLGQQALDHTFIFRLRSASFRDLGQSDAPGERNHRDIITAQRRRQTGDGLKASFGVLDAVQGADGFGILLREQKGRKNLEVLHVLPGVVARNIPVHCLAGIGNAQIDRHRQHGDDNNRDERGHLILDIPFRLDEFCLRQFHVSYQTRSVALAGSRFSLMLPTSPPLSLTTRLAIFAISGLWVIMTTVVPRLLTISSKTESTSMLV